MVGSQRVTLDDVESPDAQPAPRVAEDHEEGQVAQGRVAGEEALRHADAWHRADAPDDGLVDLAEVDRGAGLAGDQLGAATACHFRKRVHQAIAHRSQQHDSHNGDTDPGHRQQSAGRLAENVAQCGPAGTVLGAGHAAFGANGLHRHQSRGAPGGKHPAHQPQHEGHAERLGEQPY